MNGSQKYHEMQEFNNPKTNYRNHLEKQQMENEENQLYRLKEEHTHLFPVSWRSMTQTMQDWSQFVSREAIEEVPEPYRWTVEPRINRRYIY